MYFNIPDFKIYQSSNFMKGKWIYVYTLLSLCISCTVTKQPPISTQNISRLVRALSDDSMQGRGNFQAGLEKSAHYISSEFQKIGLNYFGKLNDYKQKFEVLEITPKKLIVSINYKSIEPQNCFFETKNTILEFTKENAILRKIRKNEDFRKRIQAIKQNGKTDRPTIILVAPTHQKIFQRYRTRYQQKIKKLNSIIAEPTYVFILTNEKAPKTIHISLENNITKKELHNVIGVLKGKSRPMECVIFSGHYDHVGIVSAINGDSIANGADDNASGIAGIIALATHFKKMDNNARTLIFVAFAAEEIGGYGAKYLAQKIRANEIMAMINLEMIGKSSKWGKNSAFITEFSNSNLGVILQKNTPETFQFKAEPHSTQQLFYHFDNTPFALLGIPTHTISTATMDKNQLYHSPDDEFDTLELENLKNVVDAIAKATEDIILGRETPNRVQN